MKKWIKTLKKDLIVEHVAMERLRVEEMRPEDCLCVCASIWRCSPVDIENWTASLEHRGVRWMVLMERGMEEWNGWLMTYGIEFRGEAIVSVTPHPDTNHPQQVVLDAPHLIGLPSVDLPLGIVLPAVSPLAISHPAAALLKTDALCFPPHTAIGLCSMPEDAWRV